MPRILELREIDGEIWARVGVPGDFPSGVSLWTPDEQTNHRNHAIEITPEMIEAGINELLSCDGDEIAYCAATIVSDVFRAMVRVGQLSRPL